MQTNSFVMLPVTSKSMLKAGKKFGEHSSGLKKGQDTP